MSIRHQMAIVERANGGLPRPRPSDSQVMRRAVVHAGEDAPTPASRQAPGLAKAGAGGVPTARERAALVWARAHEATGTSSIVTARHLEIRDDRTVRRFGDPASGKIANLAHVIEAPSAVREYVGEELLAGTTAIPDGRTEEEQIQRVTDAVLDLRRARDDAAKERAIAMLGREHRVLRAIRARRNG